MLKESGRIIDIKIIDGEKNAVVECISKSACKSCSSNDNCGVGVVAKNLNDKSHLLSIPYKEGMIVNEEIELFIENKDIVKSSLIVYLIPLITFVLGTLLGYSFLDNEPAIIAISLLLLILGVTIAKNVSAKLYPSHATTELIRTE